MINTTNYEIFEELDELKNSYETTSLEKIAGLYRSQFKVIKMCEYYSDSKYLGANYGNQRAVGDGKIDVPFLNVVNYRVALAKTATDLDIKDIQIVSDNPEHQVESMLLNREAYEWMKESEFSKTLNDMGLNRPKYGGYLVKKNESKGKLKIDVVRWTNVMTDQNDILGGAIVETHHMSPVELKAKDGTWENVVDVLKAYKKVEDGSTTIDVYEMTGEFEVCNFKDAQGMPETEEDEYTYSLQRYFIASIDGKKYLLFSEELPGVMTDYYEYLPWEENGYGLGRGIIEDSEEAQVWTNDAVINESIAMSLAGRVGIKTNSKKLGSNILEHDHGKIYELGVNEDINSFNLAPSALGEYQAQIERWKSQADDITSSVNAMTGNVSAGNRNYSLQALMHQVAMKHFDYFRAEWGIHLTKLFDKWVIPFLIKKIRKEHILVSDFSDQELEMIDESFANASSNQDIINEVLKGNFAAADPLMQQGAVDGYKAHIKKLGKKRFLEVPNNYFDNIECKVTVITTGEQKDKTATLQSLNDLLKTVISSFNPATGEFSALKDPTLLKIFNQILELSNTGMSPVAKSSQNVMPPAGAPNNVSPNPAPMEAPTSMMPSALATK